MSDCELIQVIRTDLLRRGQGIKADPVRRITQFWSTSGELLAEVDPCERRNVRPGDLVGADYVVTSVNYTIGDITVGRRDA